MSTDSMQQSAEPACSRVGCDGRSRYRPIFRFAFDNGEFTPEVRPDVTLCEHHRSDLVERFRSPKWQREFGQCLPSGSAAVDWSRSRVSFERTSEESAADAA